MLCHTVFKADEHVWLAFGGDGERPEGVSDITVYVLCAGERALLFDPGGHAIFPPLLAAISERIALERFTDLVLSRTTPEAAGGLALWHQVLPGTARIHVPETGMADLAHLDAAAHLTPIGDAGGALALDNGEELRFIPAHHLGMAAAFSVYDPKARVLLSGQIGASDDGELPGTAVDDVAEHLAGIEDRHWRLMPEAGARRSWLQATEGLAVDLMLPAQGPQYEAASVLAFRDWFRPSSPVVMTGVGVLDDDDLAAIAGETDTAADDAFAVPASNDFAALGERIAASASEAGKADEDDIHYQMGDAIRGHGIELGADLEEAFEEAEAADAAGEPFVDLEGEELPEFIPPEEQPPIEIPEGKKFRLITRSDFDGLACAVLLEELDLIDDILFVNPNDMQEGRVEVTENDISTNLPYVPGLFLVFDHHLSEIVRVGTHHPNHIIDPDAPSAARVLWNYFGGRSTFPNVSDEMMVAVDKADSAQFEQADVLDPQGWVLLSFLMDSRTGLGRFRGFRIPNYELMMCLIDWCREYEIEAILQLPDVKERVELYKEHEDLFKEQLRRCSTVHQNLVVFDSRDEETIYVGNRFMVYALFPQCNISMHVMWGRANQNTVFAVGKSIFDRSSNTNIGELMLTYGGGGHEAAGTCQVDNALAEVVKQALINRITMDG